MNDQIITYLIPKEIEIYNIIKHHLNEKKYSIQMIQLINEFGVSKLRISLERYDGKPIIHDDCLNVGNICNDILKAENKSFPLEISSPGINPDLTKVKDFENNMDNTIKIKLKMELEGHINWTGKIVSIHNEGIEISSLSKNIFIPYNLIRKAKKVSSK